jgi:hypothetical protein
MAQFVANRCRTPVYGDPAPLAQIAWLTGPKNWPALLLMGRGWGGGKTFLHQGRGHYLEPQDNFLTIRRCEAAETLEIRRQGVRPFWHRPFVSNMTGGRGRSPNTGTRSTFCQALPTQGVRHPRQSRWLDECYRHNGGRMPDRGCAWLGFR